MVLNLASNVTFVESETFLIAEYSLNPDIAISLAIIRPPKRAINALLQVN